MKGKIRKSNRGWVVDQVVKEGLQARLINTYPLHPYDIQEIEEQEKVFDNIEARIAAYPDVQFEIVNEFDNNGPDHFPKFARILKEDKMVTKCYCGHTSYCDCGPLEEDSEKGQNVTLNDGLENEPYVSDNFQIGPDGAYEHTEDVKSTMVFAGEGNWGRSAYIKLEDDKVIFDCSDEEYGPIVFDIDLLKDALNKHII